MRKLLWFLIFVQALILVRNSVFNDWGAFYWFCDSAALVFAIAVYYKNTDAIKGVLNVGLVAQIIWLVDFASGLTGHFVLGVTEYAFSYLNTPWILVPLLMHVATPAIMLWQTRKHKPNRKALAWSFGYLILLFVLALAAPVEENASCVREICGLETIRLPAYTLLWPVYSFIIMVLPAHLLQWLAYLASHHDGVA
ncbi:hypothetical protein CMO91_03605 [Candidatus Woesearchaeota archaeon]|nr:hypothetical protein [Candidatus Woesearchaeota archaeon]|tara:strand:+ start:340 stop:927 length:588 start_codon:yes stop_codon:yes gene_type:complete